MSDVQAIRRRYELMDPHLNEKTRRLWAGAEAVALGRGGIGLVAAATGLDRATVSRGAQECTHPGAVPVGVRAEGGGRKSTIELDPTLVPDLIKLVEATTRGDPESPLLWTTRSTRRLAEELEAMGHPTSHVRVAEILAENDYSLQGNRKTDEGRQHPDRDGQFHYLNDAVKEQIAKNEPAISVDTKKKELVGNYRNGGQEWRPKGDPIKVNVYDFVDEDKGKAIPYGIYDIATNKGWVSVGTDHDTAAFAVESIRGWWASMGSAAYPGATSLVITADCGGSNSYRTRLWKTELQKFADESHLAITVHHLPPGTSKWNKIEHRLFCHITQNWRGKPLTSHEVIVGLIGSTRTAAGLTVKCELDPTAYPKGVKPTKAEVKAVSIRQHAFHGEWNYTITPRGRNDEVIS